MQVTTLILTRLLKSSNVVPVPSVVEVAPASRTAVANYDAQAVWPRKDPDDTFDYGLNFSTIIADSLDYITTVQVDVEAGSLQVVKYGIPANANQQVAVWLKGGAEAQVTSVRIRITTFKGRQIDQSVMMRIGTR